MIAATICWNDSNFSFSNMSLMKDGLPVDDNDGTDGYMWQATNHCVDLHMFFVVFVPAIPRTTTMNLELSSDKDIWAGGRV